MRSSKQVVLATTNHHKLQEFRSLFKTYPEVDLISLEGLIRNPDKLAAVENHTSYLENANAKARLANHACHFPCLADDSGLEVMALEGRPGVRTHRYATPKAGQSQDQANIALLLEELKGKTGDQRRARFVCALALVMEGILIHSTGTIEGRIAEAPSGRGGFGYDPIFIPEGHNRTISEMTEDEKNSLSHRARALHALMLEVKAKGIVFARP